MTPEIRQYLLEKLVDYIETDMEDGEDYTVWIKDENLTDCFRDWLRGKNCPFPWKSERREIGEEAYRIFYERHPEAKKRPGRQTGHTDFQSNGLKAARRIKTAPEDEIRVYTPAPVVGITRYGVVKWLTDGRQHRAGDPIPPRTRLRVQTVRFRYNGQVIERSTGWMLESVGWVKQRGKNKKTKELTAITEDE